MTVHALPPRPGRLAAVPAPKHLGPPERNLWEEITSAHRFDDVASLAMLTATLEARQRARKCREQIDKDGEAVRDRWGQIKPHPLLAAERDARSAFMGGMKQLRLDLGGIEGQ